MRNIGRHLSLTVLTIALAACAELTEPLFDQGQIDHVNVLAWPWVVEEGDTLSASADAAKANGMLTAWTARRDWRTDDSSIIGIRTPTTNADRVVLDALRPGFARVYARIGDHESSDSVRIIPRLAPITFTPSVVSMHLGDSVLVVADIRTRGGDPVTGVNVYWNTGDIGVVSMYCCSASTWLRSSAVYGTPGSTTVTATVGHATGMLSVTVSR